MSAERKSSRRASQQSGVVVRPLLAAGLGFLEVARAEPARVADLAGWMRRWVVAPGLMPMPGNVFEPGTGIVPLGTGTSGPFAAALDLRVSRLLTVSRVRVAVSLGGLLASPSDDRFLSAAIFTGRVERASGDRGAAWRAAPKVTDRLSDIVLGLFAADVLSNREEYDACLCVCDLCGRVALQPGRLSRTRCEQHEGSIDA
jgi:hypothetical protein